ncbi:MAG: endonuclease/exonuclease/phosphatase family protein [archaeon]|nr:MAG: endonuclease/exonuclease/phosphatase family protein [archaeon]
MSLIGASILALSLLTLIPESVKKTGPFVWLSLPFRMGTETDTSMDNRYTIPQGWESRENPFFPGQGTLEEVLENPIYIQPQQERTTRPAPVIVSANLAGQTENAYKALEEVRINPKLYDADVLAFQEFTIEDQEILWGFAREGYHTRWATEFFELEDGYPTKTTGNVVFTRRPIDYYQCQRLMPAKNWYKDPIEPRVGNRVASHQVLTVGDQKYLVSNTHIEDKTKSELRERQILGMVDRAERLRDSLDIDRSLLVGDFNVYRQEPVLESLRLRGYHDRVTPLYKRTSRIPGSSPLISNALYGNGKLWRGLASIVLHRPSEEHWPTHPDMVFTKGFDPESIDVDYSAFEFSDHVPITVTLP